MGFTMIYTCTFHLAVEIKGFLQELEVHQVSGPAWEAGLAVMAQGYTCASSLPKYKFLLLFHQLGLICHPKHLSLCKAGKPQAHPRYLVVVLVFILT